MQHAWYSSNPRQAPRGHRNAVLAVFAAAGLAACADAPTTLPRGSALTRQTGSPIASVTCNVTVRTRLMRCGAPAQLPGGLLAELYIGGQGTNVQLTGSNPSYTPGTGDYRGDVTVQNLTSVPIGTPDGSTVTGLRVFFHQMPVATSGTGTITITNADGTGAFTAAGQPFYLYNQILAPDQTSTAKTWIFNVPPTVLTFQFQVYVAAATIDEQGPIHWNPVTSPTAAGLLGVWAFSTGEAFAVGVGGVILRKPAAGQAWALMTSPTIQNLAGVWGSSPTDVYAVGGGGIFRYDGNIWALAQPTGGVFMNSIDGSNANDIMVGGAAGNSQYWNGLTWTAQPQSNFSGGSFRAYLGMWAGGPADFFGAGGNGAISRFSGGVWTLMATPTTQILNGIWGSSTSNIFAVGNTNTVLRYNGATWAAATGVPAGGNLIGVHGTGANDVYIVGAAGRLMHFNGTTFFTIASGTANQLNSVKSATRTLVFAVGTLGTIIEGTR